MRSPRHGVAASEAARVRRLAVSALVTARESNLPLLREVMRDPDDQVRRLGVVWMGIADDMPLRDEAFRQAFGDASPMVRYEALRVHARTRTGPIDDCSLELSALQDANPHVVLLAIDQLGRCADAQQAAERLTAFLTPFFDAASSSASSAPRVVGAVRRARSASRGRGTAASQSREWHRAAHALVALARVAPDRATPFMARAASHEIWQVRMYAARAAGVLKDRVTLDKLAADADDNVRHAAVETLQPLAGHDADPQYLASLERGDYQLLRAAARALAGTTRKPEASAALLKAFVRISKDRRDTSRDARMALLETLEETGKAAPGSTNASAARHGAGTTHACDNRRRRRRAAAVSRGLRSGRGGPRRHAADRVDGQGHTATSAGRDRHGLRRRNRTRRRVGTRCRGARRPRRRGGAAAVPSPREIERLARDAGDRADGAGRDVHAGVVAGCGADECGAIRQAGARGIFQRADAASRRAELRRAGRQSRRERIRGRRGLHARRSSISRRTNAAPGVSTRGRDTGDGQIYINLVDNARLDHNYTVFAEVVEGMPVVDTILEGDVITRIELRERP